MCEDDRMPFVTPLRALGVSAVALVTATATSLALAQGPSSELLATPATASAQAIDPQAEREALRQSRDAERVALTTQLALAVEARTDSMSKTVEAIDATEQAIQARRAAEKAAAEKAAAEKAAEKAAADKAAADKATADKAAKAEKAAADKASADKASTEKASAKVASEKAASDKKAEAPAPRGSATNFAANRELARQMASSLHGWGGDEFTCYDNIIMRESGWDPYADNPTSSAYGIPQALPGSKMATEGSDWRTNPATQIRWGLKYIKDRYGSPCRAWTFKRANGWY